MQEFCNMWTSSAYKNIYLISGLQAKSQKKLFKREEKEERLKHQQEENLKQMLIINAVKLPNMF